MAWEVWNRMRAAVIAARRAFLDPTTINTDSPYSSSRSSIYLERWAYANSSAYDELDAWLARYNASGLYTKTRGIYNPTGRLCEFWQSVLYPGIIPQGEMSIPSGTREALPMAPSTSPELHCAILQVAQWTNFQTQKDQIAYLGAAVGDLGLEVVDDVARGKVAFKLWWPGFVKTIELDDYENVQFVCLEYQTGEGDETYLYRQEMSKESIATFKDDQPFAYEEDGLVEWANPYGFVPFNWVRHYPLLGKYSEPAMRSTTKLDRLNSLVTRTVDYIATRQKAPMGIAADWDSRGFGDLNVNAQRASGSADENGSSDTGIDSMITDDVFLLSLPEGSSPVPLFGNLEPEQVIPFIDRMLTEMEADNPELNAWAKLREMTGVSGVAIERALGDTVPRVYRTQAAYDQQIVKAFQMATAIGGMRLSLGGTWADTAARRKFTGFGLDSYERGDLDFMILPRPLSPPTENERFEAQTLKYASISAAVAAGLPLKDALLEAGYSEDEAERIAKEDAEKDAAAEAAARAARAGNMRPLGTPPVPPAPGQPPAPGSSGAPGASPEA